MSNLILNDGGVIRYELIDGDPGKPYLIFLHEGLGCVEMWRNFPQRLCEKTHCPGLIYDRTGYGKSSPETDERDVKYIHNYALTELPQVIEFLIPHKDHILIGHSDGGSIALIYASEFTTHLKGIAVEAAHVFVEKETLRGIKLADEAYDRNGPGGLQKYHRDKTPAVFKSWSETWLSQSFKAWNIESSLPSIHCPVLVIQGKNDEFGTMKQVETITSKVAGNVYPHVLEGCGHAPHIERPELLLDLLSDFICSLSV